MPSPAVTFENIRPNLFIAIMAVIQFEDTVPDDFANANAHPIVAKIETSEYAITAVTAAVPAKLTVTITRATAALRTAVVTATLAASTAMVLRIATPD